MVAEHGDRDDRDEHRDGFRVPVAPPQPQVPDRDRYRQARRRRLGEGASPRRHRQGSAGSTDPVKVAAPMTGTAAQFVASWPRNSPAPIEQAADAAPMNAIGNTSCG